MPRTIVVTTRSQYGLPEDSIVYCNFNQFTQRNLNDAYQNLPDVVPTPSKPFVETPVDM